MRLIALAAATAFVLPGTLFADVPDLGPSLRHFDPKKKEDCECVKSALEHARALQAGYQELADSYKDTLKDLGSHGKAPTWVDPRNMTAQQIGRLGALNQQFDKEERQMATGAPASKCGFAPDADITLVTDPLTGSPPDAATQKRLKPLFPFEELYDAVIAHEYYHAAQFSAHNPGDVRLPKTRTPYGRALEEAQGYGVEIAALEKLEKKCKRKYSFSGVKIVARMGQGPNQVVTTQRISGSVCGDPYDDLWSITIKTTMTGAGQVLSTLTDKPFDNDCVEPDGYKAKHYEEVLTNSPRNYNGWYCLYDAGPPATVTIRTPKLTMSMPNVPGIVTQYDGPKSRKVKVKEGACD